MEPISLSLDVEVSNHFPSQITTSFVGLFQRENSISHRLISKKISIGGAKNLAI